MIKLLALQKQRTALNVQLKELRAQRKTMETEETELRSKLDKLGESASIEDIRSLNDSVDDLSRRQTECDDKIADTLEALERCDEEIAKCERDQGSVPAGDEGGAQRGAGNAPTVRSTIPQAVETGSFRCRSGCFTSRNAQQSFYARSDVKEFLGRVRNMLGNQPAAKRSVTGADLTIPNVVLDVIRDNLHQYSKLLPYVRLRNVRGEARQNVIGDIPEAVWTEMRGALNELEFMISDIELDGFKVGGVICIPNYYLHDSDLRLGEEILYMLGQSQGLALDKAIVYGKGGAYKMPLGFATRLAETSQPSYWGDTRAPWTDLHSSNVLKLDLAAQTGTAFFGTLLAALGKAKAMKERGEKVWLMNEATKTAIMIKAIGVNASAAIVAGMNDTMPIIGGRIITLDFIPDNNILGGYLGMYLLAEREGSQFGYSDLPLFIQDKTVFKATARYDGQPVYGECFVAVTIDNTDVVTSMSFAVDYANTAMNALILTAAAGSATGKTVVTVAGAKADSPTLKYKAAALMDGINVGDVVKGFTALTSGTTEIEAAAGTPIVVVELDAAGRVVSKGVVASVPKAS